MDDRMDNSQFLTPPCLLINQNYKPLTLVNPSVSSELGVAIHT